MSAKTRWKDAARIAEAALAKLEDAFEVLKEIQAEMEEAGDEDVSELDLDLSHIRDLVDQIVAIE